MLPNFLFPVSCYHVGRGVIYGAGDRRQLIGCWTRDGGHGTGQWAWGCGTGQGTVDKWGDIGTGGVGQDRGW